MRQHHYLYYSYHLYLYHSYHLYLYHLYLYHLYNPTTYTILPPIPPIHLSKGQDRFVRSIERKAGDLVGLPPQNVEPLQVST
jgi:hypothetical protein